MMRRLTREEQQQQTRAKILDTAESLFLSRGYAAVSVDFVAESAGYSRGAVYSNWRGKEALAVSVLDRRYDALTWPLDLDTPAARIWIDFELQVVGVTRDSGRFQRLAERAPLALPAVMHALATAIVTGGRGGDGP